MMILFDFWEAVSSLSTKKSELLKLFIFIYDENDEDQDENKLCSNSKCVNFKFSVYTLLD